MSTRVGFGYDIHRLKGGKKLFLGGLEIPSAMGLEGHSDADVLLHAICDAILGALASGDIGEHFPDTDESIRGMSSVKIIEEVKKKASFEIVNVDSTIITETPILTPYKGKIRESVAQVLGVEKARVSVKAKRNEGLGPIGEKRAIACYAIVLLRVHNNDYTDSG
jgi:2-C-methyl-D-erythritol 2,4-cyclodiphosphate synthase